ncbi:hypothetical protein HL42_7386 [Trichophyton rubrum]|nr:hypothetical protein HL42_7386 [Trichophyton rubrum]
MVDGTDRVDWGATTATALQGLNSVFEFPRRHGYMRLTMKPQEVAGVVQQASSEHADSPTDWPTTTMAQRTRADKPTRARLRSPSRGPSHAPLFGPFPLPRGQVAARETKCDPGLRGGAGLILLGLTGPYIPHLQGKGQGGGRGSKPDSSDTMFNMQCSIACFVTLNGEQNERAGRYPRI